MVHFNGPSAGSGGYSSFHDDPVPVYGAITSVDRFRQEEPPPYKPLADAPPSYDNLYSSAHVPGGLPPSGPAAFVAGDLDLPPFQPGSYSDSDAARHDRLAPALTHADVARKSDDILARFRAAATLANRDGWPSAFATLMNARYEVDDDVVQLNQAGFPNGSPFPNLGAARGVNPAYRGFFSRLADKVEHFFNKVASWWRDGDVNRKIKAAYHGAVENQIKRLERYLDSAPDPLVANDLGRRIGYLKMELLCLVDPSSDWPLDMRDVAWLNGTVDFARKLLPPGQHV